MNQFCSIVHSPIGPIRISADALSITEIHFLKEGEAVENVAYASNSIIRNCAAQLEEYFNGTRKKFELPVAQAGTDFQQKVWQQLERIDYGKTLSYMELSKKIGDVKAIRAVGTTNGKNKIAIVVPCHRVIGSDGSLTGYAGELWRKRWLLEHEAKFAGGVQTLF